MNTILFDLDGTLLPLDMDKFMSIYFDEMSKHFSDLTTKEELVRNIWASTEAMVRNTENRTNEEIFMEDFSKRVNEKFHTYVKRFDEFYDSGFLKVKDSIYEEPLMQKSIESLKDKGYLMIIATNPLFPKKAIMHRIRWAGLDPEDFTYISSYEENHFCKPQIKFYEELLQIVDKNPNECMMVGNDVQEDLVAGKLGMKTFLIKNHLLHRTGDEIKADYQGNYTDFYNFVQELPSIKK